MLFKELTRVESIPDIIIFVRFNKYNWKVNIEIKILEPLEAFSNILIKIDMLSEIWEPPTHNVVGDGLRP